MCLVPSCSSKGTVLVGGHGAGSEWKGRGPKAGGDGGSVGVDSSVMVACGVII
jgi:hypothetical protein